MGFKVGSGVDCDATCGAILHSGRFVEEEISVRAVSHGDGGDRCGIISTGTGMRDRSAVMSSSLQFA